MEGSIILNERQSLFLLISTILSQGQNYKLTLRNSYRLMERLKLFDNKKMYSEISYIEVKEAFIASPCIHRFPNKMSRYIYNALKTITFDYGNSALNIFSYNNKVLDYERVKINLKGFNGIGEHKSELCMFLLQTFVENYVNIELLDSIKLLCPSVENTLLEELRYLSLLK